MMGKNINPYVDKQLNDTLLSPLKKQLANSGKRLRGRLVRCGLELVGVKANVNLKLIDMFADAIEKIHLGSLIIDDIEDGSTERRGHMTLHRQIGVPLALNIGNYLYFDATRKIDEAKIPVAWKGYWYELYHHTLRQAHCGQALDLGVKIDEVERDHVAALCYASLDFKTGALTALALQSGAMVALLNSTPEKEQERLQVLNWLGTRFGRLLQIYDDIGNFCLPSSHPKCQEDIKHRRPTWIWLTASHALDDGHYRDFRRGQSKTQKTEDLIRESRLGAEREYREIQSYIDQHRAILNGAGIQNLDSLVSELRSAYIFS